MGSLHELSYGTGGGKLQLQKRPASKRGPFLLSTVSDDGRYIAFQFARLGDPAGVGRGLLVLDLAGYEKAKTSARP